MKELTPRTIRVHVDSSGNTEIFGGSESIVCGSYGLAVSDVFSQPTSLKAALQKLESRINGAQDSMDLTSTILQL